MSLITPAFMSGPFKTLELYSRHGESETERLIVLKCISDKVLGISKFFLVRP